jgi:DNA helicase-2/ATP-dependent DNA helicase PcrA
MTERASPATKAIVHQVYGPPGTGKTRYLTTKVREVVASNGPDSLVIASFSVTAAKEIASRGLGLPERSVGTLHSLAFRGLDRDHHTVALDPKVLGDWNAQAGRQWRITPDTRRAAPQSATEGGARNTSPVTASTGDELIASLDKARSTFTDPADYPPNLAEFAKAWEEWKTANNAVDYTDMIELALQRARDGEAAPGDPQVFVVDEGQDNTPLEVELILNWGKRAASLVVALDDDQAIMEWRGGDPRRMLTLGQGDEYEVDRTVLGKSYRIPKAVHAVAERWVRRLSLRQPKEYAYRTTDRDGNELDSAPVGAAWCVPQSISDPRLAEQIEHEVSQGRSVMVIASCAYMLDSLIGTLRNSGMPFHNPFRPSEPRWNPLGRASSGMSTVERVMRYMIMDDRMGRHQRLWTGKDIQAWLPLVRVADAGLARGAKIQVDTLSDGEVPWEDVAALFADEAALEAATTPDLEWLANAILPSKAKSTAYPLQVARKRGPQALAGEPQVTLGTIHSVKGGAADVVYLAPDLSAAGVAQLETVNGRDQMVRLFYVAMTRAYEELRVLAPMGGRNHVRRRDLIPAELEVPA